MTDEEESLAIIIISLFYRVIGVVVCSEKAERLNRNTDIWSFLGFIIPTIAMIWIYCMKPKIKWDNEL